MSVKVNSKVKINKQKVKEIEKTALKSLEMTAEAMKTDLISKGYMPFDSGTLQNESTFVDAEDVQNGKVSIVCSTPYARRIYFNANNELNISTSNNPNAQDHFFEPYISGKDKDFAKNTFKKFMKNNL